MNFDSPLFSATRSETGILFPQTQPVTLQTAFHPFGRETLGGRCWWVLVRSRLSPADRPRASIVLAAWGKRAEAQASAPC